MTSRKILILDSGVGGFTIVRAIREIAPQFNITYVADNAGFPYGSLNDAILYSHVLKLVNTCIRLCDPSALIIACNTVSTMMLGALRQHFSHIPILGVVPPIKSAAPYSRSRIIGLLATEATTQRSYIDDLISKFAADCRVIRIDSSKLLLVLLRIMYGINPLTTR